MSKRPVSARSHAPLALAFAAHFACYLKWRACSLARGQRVPNSDSILVTVLTTRKQAPIKMALNLTSKSKGTEQNKILINSYSADGAWGPRERGWRSSPEPCMFAVKIERSAHDQCVTWCTGKRQVCCLVSQDIGLMMKGRLLTATLVSQKKLERDKRVRVTGVGSLLLPSDPWALHWQKRFAYKELIRLELIIYRTKTVTL